MLIHSCIPRRIVRKISSLPPLPPLITDVLGRALRQRHPVLMEQLLQLVDLRS
ncbi:MAG: hypothetical protein ACOYU7_06690 [Bacillota bacterium]|uniref:hypothetical protein n=1 Tax=unclassified Candidatus Desulforudis TaxID=2635950 RepID=UPI00346A0489